jgi:hypothetical protein
LLDSFEHLPVRNIHGMATAIKADPGMGDYHSGEYIFGFCHALFLSRLRSTCLSLDWASCCPWLPVRTRILCRLPEHLIALRLSLAPATTFTLQRQDKLRQDSLDRRQHRTCGCTPHVPRYNGRGHPCTPTADLQHSMSTYMRSRP